MRPNRLVPYPPYPLSFARGEKGEGWGCAVVIHTKSWTTRRCVHHLRQSGNLRLRLRFDRDFRFHRVRDEALLVRGMIHLAELLRSRLFIAGELRLLPENNPRDR